MRHFLLIIMMILAACGSGPEAPVDTGERGQAPQPVLVSPAAEEAPEAAPYKIVMLGDSLTAGFGLAADEALPERLEVIFEGNGFDVDVVNAGVSGDTTAGGLARYDWSVASAEPDLLVVALGANDFFNGVPARAARDNLAAILARAQADGVPVILASVEAGDNPDENPRIEEYAAIYPELAAEYDVPLFEDILRGVRGDLSLVQLDGLHPTREGVKVMATRMAKFIGAYLPDQN